MKINILIKKLSLRLLLLLISANMYAQQSDLNNQLDKNRVGLNLTYPFLYNINYERLLPIKNSRFSLNSSFTYVGFKYQNGDFFNMTIRSSIVEIGTNFYFLKNWKKTYINLGYLIKIQKTITSDFNPVHYSLEPNTEFKDNDLNHYLAVKIGIIVGKSFYFKPEIGMITDILYKDNIDIEIKYPNGTTEIEKVENPINRNMPLISLGFGVKF